MVTKSLRYTTNVYGSHGPGLLGSKSAKIAGGSDAAEARGSCASAGGSERHAILPGFLFRAQGRFVALVAQTIETRTQMAQLFFRRMSQPGDGPAAPSA